FSRKLQDVIRDKSTLHQDASTSLSIVMLSMTMLPVPRNVVTNSYLLFQIPTQFSIKLIASARQTAFNRAAGDVEDFGDIIDFHALEMVHHNHRAMIVSETLHCFAHTALQLIAG